MDLSRSPASTQPGFAHLQKLVELIFSDKYRPGDRLVERDLATQLELSRIPIREGLLMLAARGLILKDESSRGMRLRHYSPTEVLHLYEYREAIELTAIYNACQNRTQTQLVKLELLCDELAAEADNPGAPRRLELDWQFHHNIIVAGGNERFITDFSLLMVECNYVFYHIIGSEGRAGPAEADLAALVKTVAAEHREIVQLIGARDSERATQAMRTHLLNLSHRVHRRLVETQFRKLQTNDS